MWIISVTCTGCTGQRQNLLANVTYIVYFIHGFAGVVKGKEFFENLPVLCEAIACLCLTACICAFLSLSSVSLHRFIYVCHHDICAQVTLVSLYSQVLPE